MMSGIGALAAACGGGDDSGVGGTTADASGTAPLDTGTAPQEETTTAASGTEPAPLPPYDPNAPAGSAPDLPRRLAFANQSDAEFFLAFQRGLEAAAADFDLEFVSAISDGDPARNVEQIESFLARGIAALAVAPGDAAAQRDVLTRAIDSGVAVETIISAPSTIQININQFDAGYAQGLLAAEYITRELGGEAEVAYFNLDSAEALQPRHQGVLAALETAGPGVSVVSDIEPDEWTVDSVFDAMSTVLQAHPNVKVVLGSDFAALGALAAFEAAGMVTPETYIVGMDGESGAIAKIEEGDNPFKATLAFPTEVFAYGFGMYAAEWLQGKSIPQAMDTPLFPLTLDIISQFRADMADPRGSWESKREQYNITLWGNISYDTKDDYLDYIWIPESEGVVAS